MALCVDLHKKLDGFTLDVSFSTDAGVTALLGASGCGKSMTLKCIAGVERPDEGRITLDGRTLYDSAAKIDLPPQKRGVGYLFQSYALFPNLTVEQNILEGLGRVYSKQSVRKERLCALIASFQLAGLEARYPRELSGGQAQRVALCRMLAAEPEAILLDEPFAALDSHLRWQVEREVLDVLSAFGGVALLVSHDRGEAYRMSRRVVVLSDGKADPIAETRALFTRPRTLQAALISGCKNASPAEVAGPNLVYVRDWNATLACAEETCERITHVGVRARYLQPCDASMPNAIACVVEGVQDDVFSRILILRPNGAAGTLRAELDAKAGGAFAAGDEAFFAVSPENVMLLGTLPQDK